MDSEGNNRAKLVLLVVKMLVLPLLFYLVSFCIITSPLILRFSTHFFGDMGDGAENYWNLWWMNKAITQLHQSIWHTSITHYPYGVSLLGHTLVPFDGLLATVLLRFLPLVEVYNICVIFGFVGSGLTTFLLAHYLTESYWASLIAGYIFGFSSYQFAHGQGHMNLISLEGIPLFVLLWLMLLSKPTKRLAVGAAIVLFLVLLCEYNYFFYCFLAAIIIFIWRAAYGDDPLFFTKRSHLTPLLLFCGVVLVTSGVLVGSLVSLNRHDLLLGIHPSEGCTLDVLSPFVYGPFWKWSDFTRSFWSKLACDPHENGNHLGLSVVFLLAYVWRKRKVVKTKETGLLFSLGLVFTLFSFGPVMHVWGKAFPMIGPPYAWLEAVFPPLRISGMPVRFFVMAILCAALISAVGFQHLFRESPRHRVLAVVLILVLIPEYLGKALTTSPLVAPGYVNVLRDLPGNGAVLDTVATSASVLFFQTVHQKPIAFGPVARIPRSVDAKDRELRELTRRGRFDEISRVYGFRYFVLAGSLVSSIRPFTRAKLIWTDGRVFLFDFNGETEPQKQK